MFLSLRVTPSETLKMATESEPSSVMPPAPSMVVDWVMFLVVVRKNEMGPPQLKVTVPPPANLASSPASVQLLTTPPPEGVAGGTAPWPPGFWALAAGTGPSGNRATATTNRVSRKRCVMWVLHRRRNPGGRAAYDAGLSIKRDRTTARGEARKLNR